MSGTLRRLNRYWHSLFTARGGAGSGAAAVAPRAAGSAPDDARGWVGQAAAHLARHEREDARDCYEIALAHAPDCTAARLGLARLLRESGETAAALEEIRQALQIAPRDPTAHFESALVHNRSGDVQGALAAYQRVLELDPDCAAAATNLGLIYLSQLGDPRSAQRLFERAIELDASSVAAQANLGLALEEEGRVDAALAHYEALIAAHPAESEYRWNRGLALLAGGDYARGWDDYEMRNARASGAAPRAFPYPVWRGGESGAAAALLIYAEQGMGDEIMFASCVPDLLARGINCVLECDRRLAALFTRSFPAARVHGAARDGERSWLAQYPEITEQIAIGSLPRLTRRNAADFPQHAGYLRADAARVTAWRTRLKERASGRCVGIAWGGGTAKTRRDLRSVALAEIAPLCAVPRITCVNLQRDAGPALAEIASAHGGEVLHFDEIPDNVDETAALLQALDGVVTVDNSIAHLAGALGRRTWIMLPHHADWRWLRTPSASAWYPSVVLCRQTVAGHWSSVIDQVRTGLATLG
jgi:tetratricopeptide (TPR) repeat protein